MAIAVDFCDEADFYRIFSITSDAFGNDQPYIDAIFPNHHEGAGRVQGAQRFLHMKRTDPANRFIKATDTATGEIMGHAKWIVFDAGTPTEAPLTGDYWKTPDEKEYAAHVFKEYLKPRRMTARSVHGPLVSLDLMTIDPKYQRRGAGAKLMEWGVNLADELGAEMCVETSPAAQHLYEQNGFRVTEDIEIPVPERWADKPKIEYGFMRRPKATAGS